MMSLPIGCAAIALVLLYALTGVRSDVILNTHSIVLVVAGTAAVLCLSTPWSDILGLFASVARLKKAEISMAQLNLALVALSKRRDAPLAGEIHPLIAQSRQLWEQGADSAVFKMVLTQQLEELNRATEQSVATMRNLAKYPPALGMTGTVVGLISLFAQLSPENKSNLGPSLALAMTATFYGLITANVLLMPLADRLYILHLDRVQANEHVYNALLMINDGEAESLIEDGLNAAAA